ncbi:hypothetical protein [Pararhizobium sp.]|uniref:hypothetical protein n=1 Tax=Pararhizobium sp. TaxID=1977563 RepID=UPI003D0FE1CE
MSAETRIKSKSIRFYAVAEVRLYKHNGGKRDVIIKTEKFDINVEDIPLDDFLLDGRVPWHAVTIAEEKIIEKIDLKYYPDGILKSWNIYLQDSMENSISTYETNIQDANSDLL